MDDMCLMLHHTHSKGEEQAQNRDLFLPEM